MAAEAAEAEMAWAATPAASPWFARPKIARRRPGRPPHQRRMEAAWIARIRAVAAPAMVYAQDASGARVGVQPHHSAIGTQPFDAVVEAPGRICERPVDIREGAGMGTADMRQDTVERHGFAGAFRRHDPSLRRRRRNGQQKRRNSANEKPPAHAVSLIVLR